MAVYRVNKNRSYTVMANFHLRDKNLSLKAVGLLSKMLSFNDGWKFSTRGLSAICKEGPDAITAVSTPRKRIAVKPSTRVSERCRWKTPLSMLSGRKSWMTLLWSMWLTL